MIEDVASSTETVAPDAGYADRSEAVNQHARLAFFVEEADPSVHEFGIAFEHTGANPGGRSGRAQEKNPAETNGQLELRTARFDSGTPSGEYVQRAVKENRVQRILAGPFCRGIRKRHSPCRNAVTD